MKPAEWESTGEEVKGLLTEKQVGSHLRGGFASIIRQSNSLCMDQRLPLGCRYLWHIRHAEQRLAPSHILLTVQPQLWLI